MRSDALRLSLDGEWDFWLDSTADRELIGPPERTGRETGITVPGHWQTQGHDVPQYLNARYPFPIDPPFVPTANPTGVYRRSFVLPDHWLDRARASRLLLRLEGVDSCGRVWLNGSELGVTSGSRLVAEFDVTDTVRRTDPNELVILVHQWSSGSYLEDQDTWRLSGIFRSVSLAARPRRAVDDLHVHADFDPSSVHGLLRVDAVGEVTCRIDELDLTFDAGATLVIPDVVPWSSENPRLYRLVIRSADESVTVDVGFRRIEIRNGVLLANGAPLHLRGVNRHDWNSQTGRAVGMDQIRREIILMKQHNINAVRTSHYPPPSGFLDLCDRFGLWVIEECDFETHGFFPGGWDVEMPGNPVDDPEWEDALRDRAKRMVTQDRHHPSVFMWSLGNECGSGRNLRAMAQEIRALDARPLHYERDWTFSEVDVVSRMYLSASELADLVHQPIDHPSGESPPILLCEYAHAMGNGPGGLTEYVDLFDRHDRLAGGFIWEWMDQALTDESGALRYGGGFGDQPNDGNYCIDGLLFADGTPSPALKEVKQIYAPVGIDVDRAVVTVRLKRGLPTAHYRLRRRVYRAGALLTEDVTGEMVFGTDGTWAKAYPAAEDDQLIVTHVELARETSWAPIGHEVCAASWEGRSSGAAVVQALHRLTEISSSDERTIGRLELDPSTGFLRDDPEAISGMGFDTWRAVIDNDRDASWEPWESKWRKSGIPWPSWRLESFDRPSADRAVVLGRIGFPGSQLNFDVSMTWIVNAERARLRFRATAMSQLPFPLPLFGLTFSVPPSWQNVTWYGDGPGESYPDSRSATTPGLWSSNVPALQTPYLRPQENGRRGRCSAVVPGTDRGDSSLIVTSDSTFGAAIRPWSTRALDEAAHNHELKPSTRLAVTLDVGHHGLGSASCGPSASAPHRCVEREYVGDFAFTIP